LAGNGEDVDMTILSGHDLTIGYPDRAVGRRLECA